MLPVYWDTRPVQPRMLPTLSVLRLASMLVNVMDTTEQVKSEASLRYERNLFRTLIDNLPIAVYVQDASYRKIVANPVEMRWMREFTPEGDVLGKTDLEIFPPEVAAPVIMHRRSSFP